jgi:isopenicillin N synthase-like dioxygenase
MNIQKVVYGSKDGAKRFAQSLKETGFGVLTNHPINVQLIYDVYADWEKFFASEEKHAHTFDPAVQSGYFPFRSENAKGYSAKDLKEFFHVYSWSQLPPTVSARTWDLFKAMYQLAGELLTWIEEATPADIRGRFSMPLPQMIQDSRETLLRILHYPPLKGSADEAGAIRAAAHEDINLITLLPAATAPGLQVKDANGHWIDVECNPGDIVINVGDMLQMASEGYYVSTTHQVINPPGELAKKSRYSMPLFLHARADVRLSKDHTARSYLDERLREIGLKV